MKGLCDPTGQQLLKKTFYSGIVLFICETVVPNSAVFVIMREQYFK